MPKLTMPLAHRYGTQQDALEDLCDTLIVEPGYAGLDADKQLAFHDWAFKNAEHYLDGNSVDWMCMLHDWYDFHANA